jgi:hypothetical protein
MMWALGGFIFYFVVGYVTENLYPFSAYSMYASVPGMTYSGVPTFFVKGEVAVMSEYVDFVGLNTKRMMPPEMRCTLSWMVYEAERWIMEHKATETGPTHVDVAWGYRVVSVEEDGSIHTSVEIACRGRARKR